MRFVGGDALDIAPGDYEPWQLNGDDGSLYVSVAGGGLAVWDGESGGRTIVDRSANPEPSDGP